MASERPHLVAPRKRQPLALLIPKFQWPLNGHTSLRRSGKSTLARRLSPSFGVSMASERPHLVAPGHVAGCWVSRPTVIVSMASERPHLVAPFLPDGKTLAVLGDGMKC